MSNVLIIDDEPMFRDYLRRILEREGFSTVEAGDGEEGLSILESTDVDLIIVDIVMPKKDGMEFLVDLAKRKNDAGVIAISGGGRPSGCYLVPAQALGATKTLTKPFDRSTLIEAVNEVLGEVTLS